MEEAEEEEARDGEEEGVEEEVVGEDCYAECMLLFSQNRISTNVSLWGLIEVSICRLHCIVLQAWKFGGEGEAFTYPYSSH